MANRQFVEIYMQFGDPLQSCQGLRDHQVGYWTGNGRIDRTVEAPHSGRLVHHLSTPKPVYNVDTICTYHLKIPRDLPIGVASASSYCQVAWRLPDDDLHLIVGFDNFQKLFSSFSLQSN